VRYGGFDSNISELCMNVPYIVTSAHGTGYFSKTTDAMQFQLKQRCYLIFTPTLHSAVLLDLN
jgi:hypothetical protein